MLILIMNAKGITSIKIEKETRNFPLGQWIKLTMLDINHLKYASNVKKMKIFIVI